MIPVWLCSPEQLALVPESQVAKVLGRVPKASREDRYPIWPGCAPATSNDAYAAQVIPITTTLTFVLPPARRAPRGWRRYRRSAKARSREVPRLAKHWPPRALRRAVARDARKALRVYTDAEFMGVTAEVVWREGGASAARALGFK